jgi:hypothetical protein
MNFNLTRVLTQIDMLKFFTIFLIAIGCMVLIFLLPLQVSKNLEDLSGASE